MYYNDNDSRFLLQLIYAIVNDNSLPSSLNRVEPSVLFRLANKHGMANILYYYSLGTHDNISDDIKKSYYSCYSASVFAVERNKQIQKELMWIFENANISVVLLKDYRFLQYFRKKEMCEPDFLYFMISPEDKDKALKELKNIDYSVESSINDSSFFLTRSPSSKIHIVTTDFFVLDNVKKFVKDKRNLIPVDSSYKYIYSYSINDYYILFISYNIELYVRKKLRLRDLYDMWLYYSSNINIFNLEYIQEVLENFDYWMLAVKLMNLCKILFENETVSIDNDMELYDSMREYILSFGEKSDDIATNFEIIDIMNESLSIIEAKENRDLERNYLYPDKDYMRKLYPRLARNRIGLFLAYIIRRLSILFSIRTKKKQDPSELNQDVLDDFDEEDIIDIEDKEDIKVPIRVAKDVKIMSDDEKKLSIDSDGFDFVSEDAIMDKLFK